MDNNLLIPQLDMFITKNTITSDGVMRWTAVNSDIDWDLYGEKMSLELYQKMIGYIKNNVPPPAQFKSAVCSDYWCGGMPYLSIAHYGDGNGKAVPGEVLELFTDGGKLKAKGVYFPNNLGQAVYKSVKADENINPLDEDKIRISIGFLDLAHKHGEGGTVFHRKSLTDVCPQCVQKAGEKIYLDGYLVHLALTRVPVNPRTEMKVDKSMAKPKTKKEDALSVIKDSAIVEEVVSANGVEEKSVLVEMSDTPADAEVVEQPVVELEVPALVEDSKAKGSPKEDEASKEDDEEDKKEMKSLTAEDVAAIVKSVLAETNTVPNVQVVVESIPEVQKSDLDVSVDELYTSINTVVEDKSLSLEAKLQSIQPSLEKLGTSIITTVKSSVGQPTDTVSGGNDAVLKAIQDLSLTVRSEVEAVRNEIAIVKAQIPTAQTIQDNRVPSPRSLSPNLVSQALQTKAQEAPKAGSVRDISRRSVGLS